jgi:hypothetical protein
MNLAAKSELGILLGAYDARLCFAQRGQHLLGVVADRGDDAHPGNGDAFHLSLAWTGPWR